MMMCYVISMVTTNSDNEIRAEALQFAKKIESYSVTSWQQFPDINLYMDQVLTLLNGTASIDYSNQDTSNKLTSNMVNNYVKDGYINRPDNKKYDKNQVVTLYLLMSLKAVLPISVVAKGLKILTNENNMETVYSQFIDLQKESLEVVSRRLMEGIANINLDETALGQFALQLANESNILRIAAEKIFDGLAVTITDFDAEKIQ